MSTKAQQPSQAAMDAAIELQAQWGAISDTSDNCRRIDEELREMAAIIDRRLSAERQEVRQTIRDLLRDFRGVDDWAQSVRVRAEALLSKMGGE